MKPISAKTRENYEYMLGLAFEDARRAEERPEHVRLGPVLLRRLDDAGGLAEADAAINQTTEEVNS